MASKGVEPLTSGYEPDEIPFLPTRYVVMNRIELLSLVYRTNALPLRHITKTKVPPSLRAFLYIPLKNYMGMPCRKVAPVRSIFTIFFLCVCIFFLIPHKDNNLFLINKFLMPISDLD